MNRNGLVAWCLVVAAATAHAQQNFPYCQILDRVDEPAWQAHVEYVAGADVDDPQGDDFSVTSLRGGGGLYYWRTGAGDVDLSGHYLVSWLSDDGGIGLPDQVADVHVDAAYVWRRWDGSAVRFTASPGVYSDLKDPGFSDVFVPFEVVGVQAFNDRLSGLLGVAIYPGFDRHFDPRFGVRYAVDDAWSVDVMYPESRVLYRPSAGWEVYAGIRNEAVAEFNLDSDDDRDSFQYDETRVYAGVHAPLGDLLRIMVRAGWALNRTADFGRGQPARDVDDAMFLSAGVGGAL
jgi:hypothetical protein